MQKLGFMLIFACDKEFIQNGQNKTDKITKMQDLALKSQIEVPLIQTRFHYLFSFIAIFF